MKKKLLVLLSVFLMTMFAFSIVSCSSQKLSPDFNEADVISRAKEVVDSAFTLDYAATADMVREDLKSNISASDLEKGWGKTLSDAGAFTEYTKVVTAGQKDKNTDDEYAVVALVCKCKNDSVTFTISVDKNLEVVGMFLK